MNKASYNTRVFTTDESNHSINGMIEPRGVNTGETVVKIDGIPVLPGETYGLGVTGCVMEGYFSLRFMEEPNKRNEFRLLYGALICE